MTESDKIIGMLEMMANSVIADWVDNYGIYEESPSMERHMRNLAHWSVEAKNFLAQRAEEVAQRGAAGAHEPTSDQAGHSGASHQETGGPEYEQVGWWGPVSGFRPLDYPYSAPLGYEQDPVFRKVTHEATQEEEA